MVALSLRHGIRRPPVWGASALLRRPRVMVALAALAVLAVGASVLLGNEGQLTVTSQPAGAAVFLDGRRIGETPLVVSTRLVGRSGRIEVRAPGYAPAAQRFSLRPGERERVHIALVPLATDGSVRVESEPPGATVTLDGAIRGRTPLDLRDLRPGEHRLTLALPGYRELTQSFAVPGPATLRLVLQPLAAGGSVRVESQPAGAIVWLDGEDRGRTPVVLDRVPPGRHELRIGAPRYYAATRMIDVESGRLTTVSLRLEPVVLPEGPSPAPGQPPVVVMVENHPEARPQSGLDRADVVYEALVEGGVTRFMAVYSTADAPVVGPVRSMRDYFVYWASEYQPIFAHIGGSPQSYHAVAVAGLRHFEESPAYGYWRTRDRAAPHNAYLDTAAVRAAAERLGMLSAGAFAGLLQYPDWPASRPEVAGHITMRYPGGYRVAWAYSPARQVYLRSMDGRPHTDAITGAQLAARALIVQRVATRSIDAEDRQAMDLVGQGKIAYFVDGRAGVGTWHKATATAPTYFFDAAGERLVLPPGQVWIQVLPLDAPLDWGE